MKLARTEKAWRSLVVVVLATALAGVVWWLWLPSHIVWTRNAYGMAEVGAWSGLDAWWATLVHWFFALQGRAVITVAVLAAWIWLAMNWLGWWQKIKGWF